MARCTAGQLDKYGESYMGQRPKVGWNGSGAAARYSGCWVSGRWQRRWLAGKLAGVMRKKREPSPHSLLKWALFKLLPIRCGEPGPDQAQSLLHPMVKPASHARTTKCRGLSKDEHKLNSDGVLGGIRRKLLMPKSPTSVQTQLHSLSVSISAPIYFSAVSIAPSSFSSHPFFLQLNWLCVSPSAGSSFSGPAPVHTSSPVGHLFPPTLISLSSPSLFARCDAARPAPGSDSLSVIQSICQQVNFVYSGQPKLRFFFKER
ncbi:hypothetical protein GOODEAATRI_003059 [Goodea atripinnis]|uniref:Uncharacterized protein n=1 Tax=Goodea atripinnis TaxID=208336 RepID=A0ABV0MEN5_9TELE